MKVTQLVQKHQASPQWKQQYELPCGKFNNINAEPLAISSKGFMMSAVSPHCTAAMATDIVTLSSSTCHKIKQLCIAYLVWRRLVMRTNTLYYFVAVAVWHCIVIQVVVIHYNHNIVTSHHSSSTLCHTVHTVSTLYMSCTMHHTY